jgi:hypothetical protein
MVVLAAPRSASRSSQKVPERVAAAFGAPSGRRLLRREVDADQPPRHGRGSAARVGL